MIIKLDQVCSCSFCLPCRCTKESSDCEDCNPRRSCLKELFTEGPREQTESLKAVVRSCRETFINKEKEEKENEIIKLFKESVTNGDDFDDFLADPSTAIDEDGLPRYDAALQRQRKKFQHEWKLPGNIEVCGPVFKFVYGISQHMWETCSRTLRFNFNAVKLSHKPYTDSTMHHVTHAQVRDIFACNVLDRDTNMPVGDTQGGNNLLLY
jgi:hypothetical protein